MAFCWMSRAAILCGTECFPVIITRHENIRGDFKAKGDGESYAIKSLAGLIFKKKDKTCEHSLIEDWLTSRGMISQLSLLP